MIRRLLYFIVGLLLGACTVLAYAETIPATVTYAWRVSNNNAQSCKSGTEACSFTVAAAAECLGGAGGPSSSWSITGNNGVENTASTRVYFRCNLAAKSNPATTSYYDGSVVRDAMSYYCASGQGWTLSGSTCTRPDCPSGQTRNPDGTCAAPCPSYNPSAPDSQSQNAPAGCTCPSGSAWYPYGGCRKKCGTAANDPIGNGADYYIDKRQASQCAGGCQAYPDGEWMDATDGIHRWTKMSSSGWACAGTTETVTQPDDNTPKLDPTKKKPPVCAPSDGVMTTNTGKVLCVPEGTPDARKPNVKIKSKVETFPDNSTRTTTETQTTDPATYATDTRSSTTTSTKPDGTEGQAGKAGTSTSTSNVSGTGPGGKGDGDGDGGCDPTLNFCGGPSTGDLYQKKGKTMDTVLTKFKDDVSNTNFAKGAGAFFNVTLPGGSCGGMAVNVPYLNTTVDLGQYICTPQAAQLLQGVGAVLRVVVAFLAFTWAFL